MKYSKAHIVAVEERLCDYIHMMESGETNSGTIPLCRICTTVMSYTCRTCVLGDMSGALAYERPCITKARNELYYGSMRNLKVRYKELIAHLRGK